MSSQIVVHVMVDDITDEQALAIKRAVEDTLKEYKDAEIEVSLRPSRASRGR